MDKDRTRSITPKTKRVIDLGEYEIKATSSYVWYMQFETPISFKPWDQRMVRSFLKDISHKEKLRKHCFPAWNVFRERV